MNEEKNSLEQPNESKEKSLEKYNSALSLLFYEGQIAWQMNLLFIGLNVGIGSIIGSSLESINKHNLLILIFSLFGIIINVAWLGTFRRNNKYYNLRMAQARNAEPKSWKLLRKQGYKFSKGYEIIIDNKGIETSDKKHHLTSFERRASNKLAIGLAIWLFILGFTTLLFICCYNLLCTCK